jgi:hypothetical protein
MRMFRRRARRLSAAVVIAVAIAGVSLVSIPAASAATDLGQAATDYHCSSAPYSVIQLSSDGPSYVVPGAGTLTSWSIAAVPSGAEDAGNETVRFEVWRPTGGSSYELVYISPSDVSITQGSGVNSFTLSPPVAVEAGDVLGVVITSDSGYCLNTTQGDSANVFGANFDALPTAGDSRSFDDLYSQYSFYANINIAATFEPESSTLTVRKLVGGSPTPGTVFTENVVCGGNGFDVAPNPVVYDVDVDLYFDEHGAPTNGTNPVIDVPPGDVCTVTETVTGGAIVVYYECQHSYRDEAVGVEEHCSDPGPSETPLSVFLEGGDDAVITVTNGFVNFPPDGGPNGTPNTIPRAQTFPGTEPLTPLTPSQPPTAPAAAAIAVAPQFTG